MADLATAVDIVDRLGRALTAEETARVSALLVDASASVRNYTRQYIEAVTSETVRLRIRNGRAKLPQRPVTAVASVKDVNANTLLFTWEGLDSVALGAPNLDTFSYVPWTTGISTVDVTYSHGYATIPDDIVGVVCSIVMRALGREPIDAGITSESIAGYSYSVGAAGAAGAFGMLQAERDILDAYMRVGGAARMTP